MKPYIITIARQYGSGGKTVGKMLAERLHIPFYNREIITMASEDSGINAVLFTGLAFWGIYDMPTLVSVALSSYVIFIFTSLLDTPVVYAARRLYEKKMGQTHDRLDSKQ